MLVRPSPRSAPPHMPALPKLLLLKGTPLITYKGLPPLRELIPLMRTLDEPPGPVRGPLLFTPATLPTSALATLISLDLVNSSPPTLVTEYPNLLISFLIPNAV